MISLLLMLSFFYAFSDPIWILLTGNEYGFSKFEQTLLSSMFFIAAIIFDKIKLYKE